MHISVLLVISFMLCVRACARVSEHHVICFRCALCAPATKAPSLKCDTTTLLYRQTTREVLRRRRRRPHERLAARARFHSITLCKTNDGLSSAEFASARARNQKGCLLLDMLCVSARFRPGVMTFARASRCPLGAHWAQVSAALAVLTLTDR